MPSESSLDKVKLAEVLKQRKKKMKRRRISPSIKQEILDKEDMLIPLAEELTESFLSVMDENKLPTGDGLLLLAHLASTYVHVLQSESDDVKLRKFVENYFLDAFQFHMSYWDANDLSEKQKELLREKYN